VVYRQFLWKIKAQSKIISQTGALDETTILNNETSAFSADHPFFLKAFSMPPSIHGETAMEVRANPSNSAT